MEANLQGAWDGCGRRDGFQEAAWDGRELWLWGAGRVDYVILVHINMDNMSFIC